MEFHALSVLTRFQYFLLVGYWGEGMGAGVDCLNGATQHQWHVEILGQMGNCFELCFTQSDLHSSQNLMTES